ncbi:nucleotidyl transferase AbiEii/AbiGii toxin family protein [Lacticaseibacillus zeae]|uniref:Nucleotidyl transferase AbiEii/AbiGii toxin family protein n=1 Tax=Lacticaseibacillus zeae TaxID=57037 RepID=A0A5R8LGE4_LACZE|nr:nucleotidyl transferase AbiEii/AbiGii toxin family protein [Lacticaseibacillus zeae]TLF35643.1 nucleotidyl transferase AbiEii/AbiGii toxin family protein [Lacticaseibacillus zeae]
MYANLSPQKIANRINKAADALGVQRQEMQLLFRLQELLRQISESKYQHDFIFKGGFEIITLIGVPRRTTIDLDATMNNYRLEPNKLREVLSDIFNHARGPIRFEVARIKTVMNENKYPGFRVGVIGIMGKTRSKLGIDVSTGDMIYPCPIKFMHTNFIDPHDKIMVNAFPREQIMADKLVTIYQKGPGNTRAKDFYDIWILSIMESNNLDHQTLVAAFRKTAKTKNVDVLTRKRGEEIIEELKTAPGMVQSWHSYQQTKEFARGLELNQVLNMAKRQLIAMFDDNFHHEMNEEKAQTNKHEL